MQSVSLDAEAIPLLSWISVALFCNFKVLRAPSELFDSFASTSLTGSQYQTDGERFALNQSPTSTKKSCSC